MVRGSVSTHLEPQSVPSVLAWLIHHFKVKPYIEDFTHEQVPTFKNLFVSGYNIGSSFTSPGGNLENFATF